MFVLAIIIALAVILLAMCSVFIGVAWHRWREARREEDEKLADRLKVSNLDKAVEIEERIQLSRAVMEELKRAFKDDELDGGWKAALTHPLYLEAEAEIKKLQDELKVLI